MPAARRSRTYAIAAASVAVHCALLALVAIQSPRLLAPPVALGRPEPIIPVLIMPRTPPPSASSGGRPAPLRLHRRPQPFDLSKLPLAPMLTPVIEPEALAGQPDAPRRVLTTPPPPDPVAANARNALRGRLGCSSANLLNLTRAEREACEQQLAAGARDAPFQGLGLSRDKAGALGRAAAQREADFRYKRGLPGPPAPVPPGAGYDVQRSPPNGARNLGLGATSEDLGATPLKVPF